jgi:hypothetical protein
MSVCLYAIITAGNITCTINTSRHFAFESTLLMQWCKFVVIEFLLYFWRGQTVFICVNTGPLALTKTIPALPWTLFWLYKCAHISQWKTDQCSRRWTLFWNTWSIVKMHFSHWILISTCAYIRYELSMLPGFFHVWQVKNKHFTFKHA